MVWRAYSGNSCVDLRVEVCVVVSSVRFFFRSNFDLVSRSNFRLKTKKGKKIKEKGEQKEKEEKNEEKEAIAPVSA